MKEKKKFSFKRIIVDNSKFLFASFIGAIIGSAVVGYAANIIYSGSQVGYDNSTSRLNSNDVQGALDELFSVADISDRVTALESTSASIGTRVTSAETSITSLGTRVTNLEANKTFGKDESAAVTVTSGTTTQIGSVTFPTGGKGYIVSGTGVFAANATGYRKVFLASDSECQNMNGWAWCATGAGHAGASNVIGFTTAQGSGSSGRTYYLCAFQNSGTSLSVIPRIYVIKL